MDTTQPIGNSGILYKVEEKKNEKSPDYNLYITISGTKYKFSGWTGEDKSGQKCIKFKENTFKATPRPANSYTPNTSKNSW